MIAFLFLSAAFGLVEGDPAFETIRRATFFVIGLAPLASSSVCSRRASCAPVSVISWSSCAPIRRPEGCGTRWRVRSATRR